MTKYEEGSTGEIEPTKVFNPKYIRFLKGSESAFGTFEPMKVGKNGQKLSGNYSTRYQALTEKHYEAHLRGEMHLGLFPTPMGDNRSMFACLDLDIYTIDHKKLRQEIEILDLPLIQTMSKSKGCHLWLLMDDWTNNRKLRWTMEAIEYGLGFSGNEIFPKQESLKELEYGNFINLPLHGNERLVVGHEGELGGHQTWINEMLNKTISKDDLELYQLLGRKDKSGGRNNRLFCIARYLKTIDAKNWQERLKAYNNLLDEPLTPKELETTLIRSHTKRDYAPKSEPKLEYTPNARKKLEQIRKEATPDAWKRRGVSGLDIVSKKYPEPKWLVSGLIGAGLTILGGKAKIGKSWLVQDLGCCVQNGMSFMSRDTLKGNVMHYALEDNEYRLNKRLKVQGHHELKALPDYQTKGKKPLIPSLLEGLPEEIDNWFADDPKNTLVIIDTYGRVKSLLGMHKCNAYEIDVMNLSPLQEVGMKYQDKYIVMNHHLKKEEKGEDAFDLLSGSVGIQSTCDGMIVLKSDRRKGYGVSAHCMPRDGEQMDYYMTKTKNCKFQFSEDILPAEYQEILNAIKKLTGWKKDEECKHEGVRPKAVAQELKIKGKKSLNTLSKRMQRMLDRDELAKGKKYGLYNYVEPAF